MSVLLVKLLIVLFVLCASNTHGFLSSSTSRTPTGRLFSSIQESLTDYGFNSRIVTLSSDILPVMVELYDHGKAQIGQIESLQVTKDAAPKVQVKIMGTDELQVVDLGQITTVWSNEETTKNFYAPDKQIPIPYMDAAMEELYNSIAHRQGQGELTKKMIAAIENPELQGILRQVNKAGRGMRLLVDSDMADAHLTAGQQRSCGSRAAAASALALDAQLGGRFKRMACIAISSTPSDIVIVNGGWLAVDRSVCASAEARKLVQRGGSVITRADETIVHRLECLAMGVASTTESDVEVHAKEVLKLLELPVDQVGAREALVKLNRWSEGENVKKAQPWSPDALDAAKAYAVYDLKRRKMISQAIREGKSAKLEGRLDLTKLPAFCIDTKNTRVRDDAISVRPRSITGRKVIPEASRWEILVHIADVSDVYVADAIRDEKTRTTLENAAVTRGQSRYDLPSGPLHLMPPTALKALGFVTINPRGDSNVMVPNRCVTVWAYVDERDGKVIDAGIERTLISSPLALTYKEATDILSGDKPSKGGPLFFAYSVLSVVNQNIGLWSSRHTQGSSSALKREERLKVKELISSEMNKWGESGSQGFQRTLGHRLVDSCLDLYGHAVTTLLRKAKVPIPRASGSGGSRSGRVATAPLRRYVDGKAQQQALATLCSYGGASLTKRDCYDVASAADRASDRIANLQPLKRKVNNNVAPQQRKALSVLEAQMQKTLSAISTGRENEVTIEGVGAVGTCHGVRGTLKPGERIVVQVRQLNVERGTLTVDLL